MKENRSASQILFGFLPEQTVDLRGGIWKVRRWREPIVKSEVDPKTLRHELCRQAMPWKLSGKDGGYVDKLISGWNVKVLSLDTDNGVNVDPFPKVWMCKHCNQIHATPDARCSCGYSGVKGQLPFVGFHDACGAIRAPYIPRCPNHNSVKVVFPGTSSATEIKFVCPTCNTLIRKGFGFPQCECGQGRLSFNVHRSSQVYTPRSVVIVNPPSREKIQRITASGGPSRALAWVVSGMESLSLDEAPSTSESIRRTLREQGIDEETIETMVRIAQEKEGSQLDTHEVDIPDSLRDESEEQAVTIALAVTEARTRVKDLANSTDPASELGILYRDKYPLAFVNAGIDTIDLIDKFPVLTGNYGYTRGSSDPGESRLVPFSDPSGSGDYVIYGDLAKTEALFVRLDPLRVVEWLNINGHEIPDCSDKRSARTSILQSAGSDSDNNMGQIDTTILTLVHSYAHRFIRLAAVYAGIDRNALSELLVPLHLGFFLYAAARGDFVLGGLQALFESELDNMLHAIVHEDHRCPLDPGCIHAGGACMACLHLGEPSCRYFNQYLDRSVLKGASGYLEMVS